MFDKFIKATNEYTDKNKSVPAPYIRKAFELDFEPSNARICIVASGFYELYVNGKNITKGYIAPYISNPGDVMFYDEVDVTEHLVKGRNAIGVILGNGFANQTVSSWNFDKADFRAPLCFSLELEASTDGKSFTLLSDESFKTHPSHIVYDMYRYGTHADARLAIPRWSEPDFDDLSWQNTMLATPPKGEILKCTASPITKIYEIEPRKITRQDDVCYLRTALRGGEDIPSTRVSGYLYDFGKSTAGVCRLKIKGKRGQTVTLRHGERLFDDGSFGINSIYTLKNDYGEYIHLLGADVYTLSGEEEEIYVPPFTYHGFRYVFVEGISEEQAMPDLLTFEVISSMKEKRADFSCSDEVVNTLYEMGINADFSNFHYFPTDCPHREKNGWTGDISVSAEQLLLHFDCSEDLRVWLKVLARAQRPDGSLPGIAPTTGWGFEWGNGPMWDSASVIVPYYIYKYDGRTDVIRECADMIYRYLKYISSKRDDDGLVAIGLGDWCQPREAGEPISSPLILTDSATVYDMARKSAFLFGVIGDDEKKAYAEKLADEIRAAIRKNLIDFDTMTAIGSCQTSETLIISHGILDESEIPAAYSRLLDFIKEKDEHLFCGMIGLRFILDVLIDRGDVDLALRMICRPDEPSYGSMIARGATSLCESLKENGLNESENHHFLGDIIRIFHSRIAGLAVNPSALDPSSVIFSPVIPSNLDYARGEYLFPSGLATFGWRRENGKVLAYITLPEGVKGSFAFGDIACRLKAGYQEFAVENK